VTGWPDTASDWFSPRLMLLLQVVWANFHQLGENLETIFRDNGHGFPM
jgi:hypothetical protein